MTFVALGLWLTILYFCAVISAAGNVGGPPHTHVASPAEDAVVKIPWSVCLINNAKLDMTIYDISTTTRAR